MYVADLTDQLTISSILDAAHAWVGKALLLTTIKTAPCHCEERFLRRGNPYLVINESFNKSVINESFNRFVIASAFCEAVHKLLTHSTKTFTSRIKTEFNFIRLNLSLEKLKLSKTTIENHQAKVVQLLELRATTQRLEQNWQNWSRWATGGLNNQIIKIPLLSLLCYMFNTYMMLHARAL